MAKRLFILSILLITLSSQSYAYQPAVVSANPAASKAGIEILKKGGSAADAAMATAFALSVVEPHNSGLGGGGFLLYYEAKTKKFTFVDYREAAPRRASPSLFAAQPQKIKKGILSVATPGFLLGMETIHKKWRRVSWPAVIEPAIELAKKGVPLQGQLRERLEKFKSLLSQDPNAEAIYLNPLESGAGRVDQSDLAKTLENIKTGGAEVFYRGELAKKIARFSREKGGVLGIEDLKNYAVYFRRPYQFTQGSYQITTASLPSSAGNGLELLFKKALINQVKAELPYSPKAYSLTIEGIKDYFYFRDIALRDSNVNIVSHTTHISAIDAEGNIASMTNTLNEPFGSGLVVPGTGILLNNEMRDFSVAGKTANSVRPGVRPLSSMAPTIVFKRGEPQLVIGTPGGITIPQNIFQVLYYWIERDIPLGQAIRQPKIYYLPSSREVVVEGKISERVAQELSSSYPIKEEKGIGNVQALIIRNEKRTDIVSDPRGEGKGYRL